MDRVLAPPLLAVTAVGAASAYVALVNPSKPGRLPTLSCPFHAATGLWCPGCGMTRAFHDVFTGHPVAAFGTNLFWPLVVVVIGWAALAWVRPSVPGPARAPAAAWFALVGLATVYGVLRNIPAFAALAPS